MLAKRMMDIVTALQKDGMATVADLAKKCGVTEKTIRIDLAKMSDMNIINKVRGGAILANNTNDIYSVSARKQRFVSEKRQIAAAALELIHDGDTIFLDAGTTTLELARRIDKDVLVITNDPMISAELTNHKSVTLYCAGGQLQRGNDSYVFVGPDVIDMISKYHTRKCFIGCSALNLETGLMVFSSIEAEIKRAIVQNTEEIICLADSSKIGRTAFNSYLPIDRIDICVTDSGISRNEEAILSDKGVRVITANNAIV